jgi:2-aminobenzoate-CoA ligase
MPYSAHVDTFTRDNLPPPEQQPEFLFDLPELKFPERLNCSDPLLDDHVAQGRGGRVCIQAPNVRWTYADLQERANRIANVLVNELGVVPGNRVLLRAPNNPMMAACWFAVMKVGAVATATMPLLRAKELKHVIAKAKVTHALCDLRLAEELKLAAAESPELKHIRYFNDNLADGLEVAMARHSPTFTNVDTARDDTCILAFTSGTTGQPKATMHFHRDVMASCVCWPPHVLRPVPDDIFMGTPPLAFTFGLGGLLLFPLSIGASTVLLEQGAPQDLVDAIGRYKATVLFTAPTSYRAIAPIAGPLRGSTLRKCVSAGEALPAATRALWKEATGIEMIDGIGATELMHIFISADEAEALPGATGKVVPGYVACVMDDEGKPAADGRGRQAGGEGADRLPLPGRRAPGQLRQERLELHRRRLFARCRRLLPLPLAHRRHDHLGRLQHRRARGRGRLAAPPQGGRVRRDRRRRRGARPDRQGLRRAASGHRADARTGEGIAGLRQADHRPLQVSAQRRIRRSLPRTETGKLQRFRLRQSS